jgi:dienelactone hydrolase
MSHRIRAIWMTAAVAFATTVTAPSAAADDLRPLGLQCRLEQGVRFCPGNGTTERVPSWDGTPLDADVTLPAAGSGPWPTIVLLHGLGGHKAQLEPNAPNPGPGRAPKVLPELYHYNNLFYAQQGYAVLSYSMRGFGNSCGAGGAPAAQLQAPPCDKGFVRLGDTRYEARDAQYLLGLLVDEGIAQPKALGATGFSYGGGVSVELGYLNDRIRCAGSAPAGDPCAGRPDGSFLPWTSPKRVPMAMGAVYGQWLWSDLVSALFPNGRFLDFDPATDGASRQPLGVAAQSYANALYLLANLDGHVEAPQPPDSPLAPWDLTTGVALVNAGEPYGAQLRSFIEQFHDFHGGFGIPGRPAPMLLESGWNDDFFPPAESIRAYNDVRTRFPGAPVAMLLGDLGHARAANKHALAKAFNDEAAAFFAQHLQGRRGAGPSPGSVMAFVSTCPTTGPQAPPDAGPFLASSWGAIHPRSIALRGNGVQTVDSSGGDPMIGYEFDPIPSTNPLGTGEPCKTIAARDAPGTAVYAMPSRGITMLGLPTIRATITTHGDNGQLDGRLWDVLPDGTQRLVTRGVYRLTPDQTGPIVFQLHGNGYRFAPGDSIKLELAPSDAPQHRASNGSFSVEVRDLVAQLPLLCVSRRVVRMRIARPRGARVLGGSVSLNGRLSKSIRRGAHRVVLRHLPAGTVRVRTDARVRLRSRRVRTLSRSRTFHVCGSSRR